MSDVKPPPVESSDSDIPPPPVESKDGSDIPPPAVRSNSDSEIPPPPVESKNDSDIPPPAVETVESKDGSDIPPPAVENKNDSDIPPPPAESSNGSDIPPPPVEGSNGPDTPSSGKSPNRPTRSDRRRKFLQDSLSRRNTLSSIPHARNSPLLSPMAAAAATDSPVNSPRLLSPPPSVSSPPANLQEQSANPPEQSAANPQEQSAEDQGKLKPKDQEEEDDEAGRFGRLGPERSGSGLRMRVIEGILEGSAGSSTPSGRSSIRLITKHSSRAALLPGAADLSSPPSTPSTPSAPTPMTAEEKRIARRKKIVEEILSTEKTHCSCLEFMIKHCYKPMKHSDLVTPAVFELLFCNVVKIHYYSSRLIKVLEPEITHWNEETSRVARPFVDLIKSEPMFKAYGKYMENQEFAIEELDRQRKNKRFEQFHEQFKQLQGNNLWTLEMHLITPVQRLLRYTLLFKDYLAHTKPDSDEAAASKELLDALQKCANTVNENVKRKQNIVKCRKIRKSFGTTIPYNIGELITADHLFIREGNLRKLGKKKKRVRCFWLFSDCLVYGSQISQGYAFCHYFPLSRLRVKSIADEEGGICNAFQIITPEKSFTVVAESAGEKDCWIDDIAKNLGMKGKEDVMQDSFTSGHNVESGDAPVWLPDREAPHCMICGSQFSVIKRRHHCRNCGKIICSGCTKEHIVRGFDPNKPELVCKFCYDMLEIQAAEKKTAETGEKVVPQLLCNEKGAWDSSSEATLPEHGKRGGKHGDRVLLSSKSVDSISTLVNESFAGSPIPRLALDSSTSPPAASKGPSDQTPMSPTSPSSARSGRPLLRRTSRTKNLTVSGTRPLASPHHLSLSEIQDVTPKEHSETNSDDASGSTPPPVTVTAASPNHEDSASTQSPSDDTSSSKTGSPPASPSQEDSASIPPPPVPAEDTSKPDSPAASPNHDEDIPPPPVPAEDEPKSPAEDKPNSPSEDKPNSPAASPSQDEDIPPPPVPADDTSSSKSESPVVSVSSPTPTVTVTCNHSKSTPDLTPPPSDSSLSPPPVTVKVTCSPRSKSSSNMTANEELEMLRYKVAQYEKEIMQLRQRVSALEKSNGRGNSASGKIRPHNKGKNASSNSGSLRPLPPIPTKK